MCSARSVAVSVAFVPHVDSQHVFRWLSLHTVFETRSTCVVVLWRHHTRVREGEEIVAVLWCFP